MRKALLLTAFALASLANAQFTSGFENWNDTVPTDWFGSKTTLEADSVEQVSTDPHSGTYAVRLINKQDAHKRFTTQSVPVVNGQIYNITFWVRGSGNIRTAIYDGRSAGSGYSGYNAYVAATSTWTQVSQQVSCAHDTTGAQFILSVQSTAGPDHIVVDDVNITTSGGPVAASIHDIQFTSNPDGNSPMVGQIVLTGGIVTGVDTIGQDSYFIQAGEGPWSGVYVFDATSQVAMGDSVVLQATVSEFNGLTELGSVTGLVVVGQYPLPTPQLLDTYQATQEQWEGVLGVIANANCTVLPDGFNQWTIADAFGSLLVDDLIFPYAPTVGSAYDVTGIVHYANGGWKLEPRMESDIVQATSIAESVLAQVAVYPNPASNVINLDLAGVVKGRADYVLTDVMGRTVHAGVLTQDRSVVDVNAVAAGAYTLTLRADGAVKSWAVRVVR